MVKNLILIANDLDLRGLTKEADHLDSILVKYAFGWRDLTPDFVEKSVDYWSDNSITDAYQQVTEEVQDVPEVARTGAYGDEAKFWSQHGVKGGLQVALDESFDYLFNKMNEMARREYGWVISRGGSGIARFIVASIPTPLGNHTFGGGNKALTWTADGIRICGFSFEKMINKLANANESILGFSGINVLEPLYSSLEGIVRQYPVILWAVDNVQAYGEYARWIKNKTGLWNFNYESLLWNHLTSPLHDITLPNGVPFISELGQYCDLINNPTDMKLINAAAERIAAQYGQSENLAQAKAILEPRIREWQSILTA